ncbi:DUF342 domain-containing protein [Psychromonas sp. KJ10-2]|uniref:DUF342 domain-containing protein n=1 Tax=Psychromonas sp. KJ10-2 TaxID=3391822 RepID=UPI0039B583CD
MVQDKLSMQHILLSDDSNVLLLKVSHLDTDITVEEILTLLKSPSLPQFKINIDGINQAIDAFNMLADGQLDSKVLIDPIVIAEKQDAQLNITISEDKMDACASITTAYGGQSITFDIIKAKCQELGLKYGLVPKNVLGLLNACKHAKSGETLKITIAHGLAPIHGVDASFVKLVNTETHRKPAPKLLANGKVDMRDLGQSITVKAGTVLMKKIPKQTGTPGKTVTAELIPQIEGKDSEFVIHKNVQIDPKDPLQLIAKNYGIPIEQDGFIKVDDVMLLEQVSNKSGHVEYDGTVVISGDIHDNMKVKASGDITVMGVIESAQVICGGDLTVEMPIIGHLNKEDDTYTCEIICDGNLIGTIAQYANLTIGKDLTLSSQLIHCRTECLGKIEVHNSSYTQGAIIGGVTSCHKGITSVSIGTSGNTKTEFHLQGDIEKLKKEKSKHIKEIQTLDKMINKFKLAETKADAITNIEIRREKRLALAKEKQICRAHSDLAQARLKNIKAKLKTAYESLYLIAVKTIHSETQVYSAGQEWCSHCELGASKVSMQNNLLNVAELKELVHN